MFNYKKWLILSLVMFVLISILPADDVEDLKMEVKELKEKYQSELEELKIEMEIMKATATPQQDEKKFNIYGYFGFRWHDMIWSGSGKDKMEYALFNNATFSQTNLNLYFKFNPIENVETLSEIRFLYAPKGVKYNELAEVEYLDLSHFPQVANVVPHALPTYFIDTTDALYKEWGGIIIERAWAKIFYKDYLNFKMGKFFTPFGIWNVDHGLPVILTARVPYFLAFVPQNQVGIQMEGDFFLPQGKLSYAAYISNGKGPAYETLDNNTNKAFGGRLAFSADLKIFKELSFGASFFRGKYTNSGDSLQVILDVTDPTGPSLIQKVYFTEAEYYENIFGLDMKFNLYNVMFQGEYLKNTHDYEKVPVFMNPLTGQPVEREVPDIESYYVQLGYEIPWKVRNWTFTPYARYEEQESYLRGQAGEPTVTTRENFEIVSLGMNLRKNPYVIYKFDYTNVKLKELDAEFDMFVVSMAVSF